MSAANGDRGQSLLELALLLPFLVMVCAGVVDLGRVYYYDIVAINASRVGARCAADLRKSDTDVRTAVINDGTGLPVAESQILISPLLPRYSGDTVTVTVNYSFIPVTPLIGSFFPGGVLIMSRSASMVVF